MGEVADLYVTLRGISTEFVGSMDEAGAASERADSKIAGVVGAAKIAAIGFAAAAVAVGVESIKMATTFQAQMEKISTLAGVPQASLKGLSSSVLSLAGQVGFAPDSLAEALYHVESSFASTGITSAKAMALLKVASEGAKIGGADLVDVTNALDAAVVSGIPGVQNMGQAMGGLLATVGAGDMTMQDFANAASTGILATAKVYGNSLTDVGAALATFGDNNIRGQTAATDLRMSIMDLTKQAAPGQAALEKIGIASGQLGKDMQTGGLNKAMTDLHTHLLAAGDGGSKMGLVLEDAFTKKSSAPLAILLSQFDRLQSKYVDISKGEGNFASAWSKTKDTLKQQLSQIKAGAEAIGVQLGQALIPKVSEAITKAGQLFGKLKNPMKDVMSGFSTGDTTTGSVAANVAGGIRDLFATMLKGKSAVQDTSQGISRLGILIHGDLVDAINSAKLILPALVTGVKNLWQVIQPLTPALGAAVIAFGDWYKLLAKLAPVITSVTGFLKAHKVAVDSILITVGTAVALWKAWTIAVEVWSAITKVAAGVMLAFDAVMDANPIMLIVIAIAALAAGLVYAYEHSKTFRDIVNATFRDVKNVAMDVVHFFTNDIPAAFDTVLSFAKTWGPLILVAFLPMIGIPLLIWQHWSAIVGFLEGIWNKVWPYLKTWGPVALTAVMPFIGLPLIIWQHWSAIVGFFQELPGLILSGLKDAGKWLLGIGKDIIGGLLAGLKLQWVTVPRDLYRYVVSHGGLIGIGKTLIDGMLSGLTAAWTAVSAWFVSLPGIIAGWFTSAAKWLFNGGKDVVTGLWNGMQNVWAAEVRGWENIADTITAWFNDAVKWLVTSGKNIITGLYDGIVSAAVAVWNWLKALPGVLLSYVKGAETWLGTTGHDIAEGIVNGIKNGAIDLWNWYISLPKTILGYVKDAASWMISTGEDIIKGLINGIGNMAGAVGDKIKSVVGGAISGAKKFLGIGSPSKKMADEIGQWLPAGIAQGILKNQDNVTKAMSTMTGKITSKGAVSGVGVSGLFSGSATAGSQQAGGTIVNVNVYGSVMTDNDLATKVVQVMATRGLRTAGPVYSGRTTRKQ